MGEIENSRRGLRYGLARWLMPEQIIKLEEIEDEYVERIQALREENNRLRGQRDFYRDDIGLFKDRWKELGVGDYNPDEIDYEEYKKMLNYDSQVIAGWDLITMGVLMKPFNIRHSNPEIANTLNAMLQRMFQPDFRSAMKEMMKAIAYGNSVTEVVFERWDYQGRMYFAPRQTNGLKTFDPSYIKFHSDAFGNLYKVEQRISGDFVSLPLWRTLVWTHEKEFGNFYGKALLRGCYKNWYIKDVMLKFANIAHERFGSPSLLGIARNVNEAGKVLEQLEHLFARSQAVLVKGDSDDPTDIKVIETKRNEMPFDRYIRYHDEMILRRMLIGQNIFEGGGGTYGPKVPFDIILMRMLDFRLELQTVMQRLLDLITTLNWPTDEIPRFEFEPLTTMDQEQLRQAIWDALDREIISKDKPADIRFIRETLGLPDETEPVEDESEADVEGEVE